MYKYLKVLCVAFLLAFSSCASMELRVTKALYADAKEDLEQAFRDRAEGKVEALNKKISDYLRIICQEEPDFANECKTTDVASINKAM